MIQTKPKKASLHAQSACNEASVYIHVALPKMLMRHAANHQFIIISFPKQQASTRGENKVISIGAACLESGTNNKGLFWFVFSNKNF